MRNILKIFWRLQSQKKAPYVRIYMMESTFLNLENSLDFLYLKSISTTTFQIKQIDQKNFDENLIGFIAIYFYVFLYEGMSGYTFSCMLVNKAIYLIKIINLPIFITVWTWSIIRCGMDD